MDENTQQRMQLINKMLLQMASGNFHFRIERSSHTDNTEALIVTLNMLAEEIQDTIVHQGYANTDTTVLDIVQMSFILDGSGVVEMANHQACDILSRLRDEVIGKPFDSLLGDESRVNWNKMWKRLDRKTIYDTSINLIFRAKTGLAIPKVAYISVFPQGERDGKRILVTIVHHSNYRNKLKSDLMDRVKKGKSKQGIPGVGNPIISQKPKVILTYEDIRIIRQARDVIVNNPEIDFPPLKDFALQIGTNEFKLKYGFKQLYGTTVHNFLLQERLRKAQIMIQYSDRSVKSIAYMSGFKSLPHFSRTFKKRYGFSPTDLRKNSNPRGQ